LSHFIGKGVSNEVAFGVLRFTAKLHTGDLGVTQRGLRMPKMAGCAGRMPAVTNSWGFAEQNPKLKIRMDADFQQRKG
jgi:hypothetical protein